MSSVLQLAEAGQVAQDGQPGLALWQALERADIHGLDRLHGGLVLPGWRLGVTHDEPGRDQVGRALLGYERLVAAGLTAHLGWVEVRLAHALGQCGDLEAGIEWLGRIEEEATLAHDERLLVMALTAKAALWGLACDFDEALALGGRALELCRDGLREMRAAALHNHSDTCLLQARDDGSTPQLRAEIAARALALADQALGLLTDTGDVSVNARGALLGNRLAALTMLGRHDEAGQAFLQGRLLQGLSITVQVDLLCNQAELLLQRGRVDEVLPLIEHAADLLGADNPARLAERLTDLQIRLARLQGLEARAHGLWQRRLHLAEARGRQRLRQLHRNSELISRLWRSRKAQQEACAQAEELRLAKAQLEGMINAVPDMLFVIDGQGIVLSSHCVDEKGYIVPPEQFLGRPIPEILPSAAAGVVMQALRRAGLQGVDRGAVYSLPMADGLRWYELSVASVRHPDGAAAGQFVALVRDITQRVRVESELRSAKLEAELANRAKTSFLANISHEIRTPLNAVIGYADMLSSSPGMGGEPRQFVEEIRVAGQHLLGLINDVLDLSRIEAERFELQARDFDLRDVIDSLRSLTGPAARAKGLTVELGTGEIPPLLHGDPGRLRQALLNYLNNAIKFTQSGSIHLSGELLEAQGDTLKVRFTVCDTGIGIAEDMHERLFERFEQADASSTRSFEGVGLGLPITRRLAQMMDGDAGVRSRPGQGSCFWFTATLHRARSPASVRPARAAAGARAHPPAWEALRERLAGLRVLLVEDNAVSRTLATRMLRQAGAVVETASNGGQALVRCRQGGLDVVMMDVQMPGIDGLQATRMIRQFADARTLPIIAITGNAFDWQRQECLEAGMNAFVTKPIDWHGFWATLQEVVSASAEAAPQPLGMAPVGSQDGV